MEDDFKSIPKLGAKVWQPLLDGKAITFGAPTPTAHCEPESVSSNSSVEDTQNQSKSSTDTAVGPPTQSTPVHIAQAHFQFQPHYMKIQSSALQPLASGDNQIPGLGHPPQGSADKALSYEAMAAEIAQLRQQLQFTKETLEDVWDHYGSEIWLYEGELESLKEDKSKIEMVAQKLQVKQEDSKANLQDAHHWVDQLEQRNAQLEACNQDLKKRYQEGLKGVMASSQASTQEQSNPQSSCSTPIQSLPKAVQAKPVTGVVKPEVSLSGGSIVCKPSRGHVTQVTKAQPLDIVQRPEATEPLGVACALPLVPNVGPQEIRSLPHLEIKVTCHLVPNPSKALPTRVNPPSPPNGSEVRPKKVDLSTTHPRSLPNTNRPPAGTKVLAPAPKEYTLDHLGFTINKQIPGNVYQGSSTSTWGVKAFPRIARDCGPMPPGRDIPHQYKTLVGNHYGHLPPGREHPNHQYRSPPPLSHVTQWDMANFHHTTPTMENATVPQRPGPIELQQASSSYHVSQSCPSSGYLALSETHNHPSQVLTSAQ